MSQALPQLEDCVCCENAVRQRSLNPFVAGAPQGRLSSSLVRGRDWILIRARVVSDPYATPRLCPSQCMSHASVSRCAGQRHPFLLSIRSSSGL